MSFHREAWRSAAQEYGRVRAERYGRIARVRAMLVTLIIVVLVVLVAAAMNGAFETGPKPATTPPTTDVGEKGQT